jgi:hypothetical protein
MPTRKFPRNRGRREGRPDERACLTAARSIPLTTIPHDLAITPAIALRGHIFCRQFIPREASRVRRARRRLRPRHNRRRAGKLSIATVTNPAYAFVTVDSGVTLKGRRRLSDNPRCRLTEE